MGKILKEYLDVEIYQGRKSFLKRFYRKYFLFATNAVYLIRKQQLAHNVFSREFYKFLLMRRYNIEVGNGAKIGLGFQIGHAKNITIGQYVTIGKNCFIFHNVTIGISHNGGLNRNFGENDYPSVGDNCVLFTGCTIIGSIKVADGTTVAAHAVLKDNTEPDSLYAGLPAKRIK